MGCYFWNVLPVFESDYSEHSRDGGNRKYKTIEQEPAVLGLRG